MMDIEFWELKAEQQEMMSMENHFNVQAWVPFKSGIDSLSTDSMHWGSFAGFGNNRRKHLQPEEERWKMVNVM